MRNLRIPRAGDAEAREREQQEIKQQQSADLKSKLDRLKSEYTTLTRQLLTDGNRYGGEYLTRESLRRLARTLRLITDELAHRAQGEGQ